MSAPRAGNLETADGSAADLRRRTTLCVGAAFVVLQGLALGAAWREAALAGAAVGPAQITLRIDPNRASPAELMLLPGVGPALAGRIVAARATAAQQPAFARVADLDRVPGIGPTLLRQLGPWLAFDARDGAGPGRGGARLNARAMAP